jgi:hypothetical protein
MSQRNIKKMGNFITVGKDVCLMELDIAIKI